MNDNYTAFSKTAKYYHDHRPTYPSEVIDILTNQYELHPHSIIADIGSGTGIFSQLFLEHGNTVYAIEPNTEMRQIAEQHFSKQPHFKSINATAEKTTLPDHCVDFVCAAQAFHWFDPTMCKKEFRRIMTKNGKLVLIWNRPLFKRNHLMQSFGALLKKYRLENMEDRHQYRSSADILRFFDNSKAEDY